MAFDSSRNFYAVSNGLLFEAKYSATTGFAAPVGILPLSGSTYISVNVDTTNDLIVDAYNASLGKHSYYLVASGSDLSQSPANGPFYYDTREPAGSTVLVQDSGGAYLATPAKDGTLVVLDSSLPPLSGATWFLASTPPLSAGNSSFKPGTVAPAVLTITLPNSYASAYYLLKTMLFVSVDPADSTKNAVWFPSNSGTNTDTIWYTTTHTLSAATADGFGGLYVADATQKAILFWTTAQLTAAKTQGSLAAPSTFNTTEGVGATTLAMAPYNGPTGQYLGGIIFPGVSNFLSFTQNPSFAFGNVGTGTTSSGLMVINPNGDTITGTSISVTAGSKAAFAVTGSDSLANPCPASASTAICDIGVTSLPQTADVGTAETGTLMVTGAATTITAGLRALVFSAQAASGSNSSLAVSSPTSTAGTGVTLTATVNDTSNAPYNGQTVTFTPTSNSGNATVTGVTVTSSSNVVTATLNDTTAEPVSVAASVNGVAIANPSTVSTTFSAGTPSALQSSINNPNTATAGTAFNVTITAKDQYGNPVSGASVSLSATGSAIVSGSPTTTNSSGIATFSVTDTKAESVSFNSPIVTATAITIVQAGAASATTSTITSTPSTPQVVGTQFTVNVTVLDQYGNPVIGAIVFPSQLGTSPSATFGTVPYTSQTGKTSFTVSNTVSGATNISLSASGTTFTPSGGYAVSFLAGPPSNINSTVVASSNTPAVGSIGTTVTVTLKDSYGNLVSGVPVSLLHQNSSSVSPAGIIATSSSGVATFTVTDNTAESDPFSAYVQPTGGTAFLLAQVATVAFQPGPPSASNSSVSVSPNSQTVGTSATISVKLADSFGNLINGAAVTATDGSAGTISTPPATNSTGTSSFTVTDTKVQTDTYTVTAGGLTFTTKPTVGWTVGPLSATASTVVPTSNSVTVGATTTVTVTATDQYGNPISGATVTLAGNNSSQVTTVSGTTGSNGQATFTVGDTTAEQDTFTAKVNGSALTPTAQVTFNPGPPSASNSTVVANLTTLNALQSTTVTVTLKDQYGNLIPNSSYLVGLTANSTTATISAGQATNASGQATFTVSDSLLGITGTSQTDVFTANASSVKISQTASVTYNSLTQTVTFASFNPSSVAITPNGTVAIPAASASSNLTISYTPSPSTVCTVSGANVLLVGIGQCTVTAAQAGNGTYSAATSKTATLTVTQGANVITFPAFPNATTAYTYGASAPTPAATASSALAVTYTSTTSPYCSVTSAGVITITAAGGNCSITASQAGNANYANAQSVTQSFYVNLGVNTVTFTPSSLTYNQTELLSASSASGLTPITFSAIGGCSVSGSTLTATSAGTNNCSITASQVGNSNWAAGSATVSVSVLQAATQVTLNLQPVTYSPGQTVNLAGAVSTNNSAGSVTFSGGSAAVCSVASNGQVSILGGGSCPVSVAIGASPNYLSGSTGSSFTINPASQTVNFGAFSSSSITFGANAPAIPGATATSGLTIFSYSSQSPSVCTLSGATIVVASAGTCSIMATQPGNASYSSASATQSFNIVKANQTITFNGPSNQPYSPTPIPLTATTNANGLSVSYSSSTPTTCNIANNAVQMQALGQCTIVAAQSGSNNYNAATSVTQSFTISLGTNVITFNAFNPSSVAISGVPPNLATSGTATTAAGTAYATSGLPVSFTSLYPNVCTVTGTSITMLATGTCSISASQAGSALYNNASGTTQSFNITLGSQAITFPNPGSQVWSPVPIALNASTNAPSVSGLTVSYVSNSPAVCSVSGSSVSLFSLGSCAVTASQAGNAYYNAAQPVQISFNVTAASNIVTLNPLASITYSPTATAQASGTSTAGTSVTPLTFGSGSSSVCSVSSTGFITVNTAGTCVVTASQAATGNYAAASVTSTSLVINQAAQQVNFAAFSPSTIAFSSGITPALPTATALGGASISYAVQGGSTCSLSGTTLSITAAGTCAVVATAAATTNYQQGSATQSFAITAGNNSVNFSLTSPVTYSPGLQIQLTATSTAGTSVAPITFSTTSSACTVSGSTLTVVSGGSCSVTASQVATPSFTAGTQTSTLTINQASQTVTFGSFGSGPFNYGSAVPSLPSANAPGGNITYSATTSACSIQSNGTGLTENGTGICTILATAAATSSYLTASASSSFTISSGVNTINFGSLGSVLYSTGSSFNAASYASSTAGGTITFGATGADSGVCTVSSAGAISILAGGSCVVTANQGATGNYAAAAQVTSTLAINPGVQTVSFGSFSPSIINYGQTVPFLPAASAPGGALTFSSVTPSVCSVNSNGTGLAISTFGTCTIQASQAGNASYQPASATASLTVAATPNPITFPALGAITFGATPPVPAAFSAAGGAIIYGTTSSSSVCTVTTSGAITVNGGGSCVVTANQAASGNYAAATQVTSTLTINATAQTLTLASFSPASVSFGTAAPALPAATVLGGATVTYSSTTPSVCTLSGITATAAVTYTSIGTCTVQASAAATSTYLAATATASFTITAGANVITFPAFSPNTYPFTSAPPALAATASSGLPVAFASATPSVCTVSGSAITFVASGSCSITASQAGNGNYVAAGMVTQTFTITSVPFNLTSSGAATLTVVPGNSAVFTFQMTPTNGAYPGPVTFSLSGLPPGATYTITPTTVASNAGAQTVTLTINTTTSFVLNQFHGLAPWSLALLLPVFMLRRNRRKMMHLAMLMVFISTGIFAMSGCGGGGSPGGTGSTTTTIVATHTLTLTATSGTSQVTTTVTLQVQ